MFLHLFIYYPPGLKKIFFRRIKKKADFSYNFINFIFGKKINIFNTMYTCQITLGLFYYESTTKLELKSVSL